MKVRLKSDKARLSRHRRLRSNDGSTLETNQIYTVYGVFIEDGYSDFYLSEYDGYEGSPTPYPKEIFEIVDERPSQYWIRTECKSSQSYFFREWTEDEMFHSNLVERWEPELGIFQRYKSWMDDEFRNETARENLNLIGVRTLTYKDGDDFIKNVKNIFGEGLHSDPWDYLHESVDKWTESDGLSIVASFPTSEPIVLFFNEDTDCRVYELSSCRDVREVLAGDPFAMIYITNSKKEYLLSIEGNSHIIGSGTALAWDFWDL